MTVTTMTPEPPPPACPGKTTLRFTGNASASEFQAACRSHDYWYHSFYFDNGFEQRGDYDVGTGIEDYGFPQDMSGMDVLDVGTGSGWFATLFEQRGARVTTVDVRGYCDFDVYGRPGYAPVEETKASPDLVLPSGQTVYHSPVSKGFWVMKELLGLQAEFVNARVYDLRPELFGGRTFDLVFVGSLLMHIRDPIGALSAARSVCRGTLVANTLRLDPASDSETTPFQILLASREVSINWWAPSSACVRKWFEGAGFSAVSLEGTVTLRPDRPWTDEGGNSSACEQVLHLVLAHP
ncbi:MAG: methyltransferase domain-containing protein [Thermoanaerobaculia bacterium]|nr:methyltransferase domain-containing protein [Thermoanaerobaculia bacterium]